MKRRAGRSVAVLSAVVALVGGGLAAAAEAAQSHTQHFGYWVAGTNFKNFGGYAQRPRTWDTEPLPTEGHFYQFRNLRWRGWGHPAATGTGKILLCTEALTDCQNGTVTVVLNHAQQAPEMNEYCWFTIKRSSVRDAVGAVGDPGATDSGCGMKTWH